jgi:putative membrane protein
MTLLYLKALHLIFVVTWFAGLFYIVRLFIYDTEACEKPESERNILQDQFAVMQKRLWYGITWPSAVMTALFGFSQIHAFIPLSNHPWLIYKLAIVALLYAYHLSCGWIFKQLQKKRYPLSSSQLRIWNEVATLFLVGIIFLAVLKSFLGLIQGLLGLFGLMIVLMTAIKMYIKQRLKNA